ncbi:MAG TPA: hypothetical protein VGM88_06140 [Kofleriaceae bacterium]|jgi:hypothetical protein
MKKAGLLAATIVCLSSAAFADTKAWTAAKAGLPADAKIVVGLDVAAISKTPIYSTLMPKLLKKPEFASAIEQIKTKCKIDALAAIQSIVVAMDATKEDGAIYVGVDGIDAATVASCAAKTDDKGKVTATTTGNITELTLADKTDKTTAYIGWAGKDVIVVPMKSGSKPALLKWMNGHGAFARSGASAALKTDTSAPIFGGGQVDTEIQPGVKMTAGYGKLTFAGGGLAADVHAIMTTAKSAADMAAMANTQLADKKKSAGTDVPPAINNILNSIKVTSAGSEVVVNASVNKDDLTALLALAAMGIN